MDGAPAILLGLHGSLLRQACARTGEHFAGLSAAARMLRRRGIINNKMQKQLTHLDVAAAYARHATMPLAARIEAELNAICKAWTEGLGAVNLTIELGCREILTIKTDASAAVGVVQRQGLVK